MSTKQPHRLHCTFTAATRTGVTPRRGSSNRSGLAAPSDAATLKGLEFPFRSDAMDRNHMIECTAHVASARRTLDLIRRLSADESIRVIAGEGIADLAAAIDLLSIPSSEAARKRAERGRRKESAVAASSPSPVPPSPAAPAPTEVADGHGQSRTVTDGHGRVYHLPPYDDTVPF